MNLLNKIFNRVYHICLGVNRNEKREKFLVKEIHDTLNVKYTCINANILVVGVYLTDYDNKAIHLVEQFNKSLNHNVDQKWIAIGENDIPNELKDITMFHSKNKIPKFKLLNNVLSEINLEKYDYLIITDDDVVVHDEFIDAYIDTLDKYSLKLAQPARTRYSYNVHKIVLQNKKTIARITNFVEIGPIFSFHKSIYKEVLPFPPEAEMGWGLDFIWPRIGEKYNFNLGIVDLVAVDHSYRPQSKTYSNDQNRVLMNNLLKNYDNNFYENKIILKEIV